MQHTPAPWEAREDSHGFEIINIIPDRPDYADYGIAYVYNTNKYKQNEANARLIAAAPELLEVLKCLVNLVQGNGNDHITRACNDAIKIIKKAERVNP